MPSKKPKITKQEKSNSVQPENFSTNYEVATSSNFEKEFKRLVKKYPSLDEEIDALILKLETNPTLGTPLRQNCYKIRLAIASKGKGKSGGSRVITYVARIRNTVVLLTIYDKSERESISDAELQQLLKSIR